MATKKISESRTIRTVLANPRDANSRNNTHGGVLAYWADDTAGACFKRHTGYGGVTASFNSVNYLSPVDTGDIVTTEAIITGTGNRSAEVFVQIYVERGEMNQRILAFTAFATCVVLAPEDFQMPKIQAETAIEEQLLAGYAQRKAQIKEERQNFAPTLEALQARVKGEND